MNRYLECGNLIVRTDSFDKCKELTSVVDVESTSNTAVDPDIFLTVRLMWF